MAHIMFIDSNKAGVEALFEARKLGHRISFIGNTGYKSLYEGIRFDEIRTYIDNLIWLEPMTSQNDLLETVVGINSRLPIDAVTTVFEGSVFKTALIAESLGLKGPKSKSVSNAQAKNRCREILNSKNIPSAKYCVPSSQEEAVSFIKSIGYPVVAKPSRGIGSMLARVLHNEREFYDYWNDFYQMLTYSKTGIYEALSDRILIEEYLDGPLYSVEIGRQGNKLIPLMVTQRKQAFHNPAIELGSTMPADLSTSVINKFFEYTEQILDATQLTDGIFHIEIIKTRSGPRLVEVNPRLMGGTLPILYQLSTGINPYKLLMDILLENAVVVPRIQDAMPITSRFLGASYNCRVYDALQEGWYDDLKEEFVRIDLDLKSGQHVNEMRGSFDGIGSFFVDGTDPSNSIEKADKLVNILADRSKFPFIK